MKHILLLVLVLQGLYPVQLVEAQDRPNILILFLDDLDPDFGCYGNELVTTPNIDRLASQGVRFTRAYASGTVCSPSHTSLFTGCYASTIGAPNHRSHYIDTLPEGCHILTELMSEAGYFTVNFKSNGDRMYNKLYGATAKTDLNFDRGKPENNQESGKEVFDHLQIIDPIDISTYFKGGVWSQRKNTQPFFAYANIETGKKHGFEPGRKWAIEKGIEVDPAEVDVPPHYYDNEEVRLVLASALDAVSHTDVEVGKFLDALELSNLDRDTLVILLSDHGATLPRHKQNLWLTGIHVPLIMRWPGNLDAGAVNGELASIIDIAPTVLSAAKVCVPPTMEGLNLLADVSSREYVVATRDGMNGVFDCSRAIVTKKYQYIHHFFPEIPYRANHYARKVVSFESMAQLHEEGELNALQAVYYASEKEPVELYDLEADELQTRNLATDPEYVGVLRKMRRTLFKWQNSSGDQVMDARGILSEEKVPFGTKIDELLSKDSSK
ncbi:sulfatase family protein [Pelagicoccus mobilis]|uniref:Sulfatase n=1 Tax=Pelagicoccus mobilis TaxID=415221 RepID=A0A934RY33_9BACT|nr:sulfatase [Pelagicoccus mobilis]MBK1875994.1 sulfatase [Pelagicoccus mobilis]